MLVVYSYLYYTFFLLLFKDLCGIALIDRLIDADDVLFGYIQEKISELHAKKNEYEKQLLLIERRVKKIDTKPLIEPLNRWDDLSMEEKNKISHRGKALVKMANKLKDMNL